VSLRSRLDEAETEIKRLTKTVKVVEVEVKEDSAPLREEIARLAKLNDELHKYVKEHKSAADESQKRA
jgi:archaellum component FlaC